MKKPRQAPGKKIKNKLKGNVPLRIDFGCGKHKREGFIGVDVLKFEGVDIVMDAGKDKWPWADNSVEEVHASHFVEHLDAKQRIHFVNELFRVLKKDAKATVIIPHWASCRAYGDLTHAWPPVSEFWFYYLDKAWREVNAPHNDFYICDFAVTWSYSLRQDLLSRNLEHQQYALSNFKEAAQDIIATLTKK